MTAQRPNPKTLTAILRKAIRDSKMSFKALERETGVLRQSLMKFARGKQSLRLDVADRLAAFLGLTLKAAQKPKRKWRAGKQPKRDKTFGIPQKDPFWRWWERDGKHDCNGGRDIESKSEADRWHKHWKDIGSPTPKTQKARR